LTLPGNKDKVVYITSANNLKWSKKIVAGDRLDIKAKLLSWNRGIGKCVGEGTVNGEFACKAEINFVMPDLLNNYRVSVKKSEVKK
jgi:3-hydroxymyristoyl/3-hydroxydecanoyl-(acyl carrier protein) dehydratase